MAAAMPSPSSAAPKVSAVRCSMLPSRSAFQPAGTIGWRARIRRSDSTPARARTSHSTRTAPETMSTGRRARHAHCGPSRCLNRRCRYSRNRGSSRVVSWSRGRGRSMSTISATRPGLAFKRHHAVAEVDRLFEIVGDEQHGRRRRAEARDLVLQALPRHGVERAERLVHQQQARAAAPGSARSARAAACRPRAASGNFPAWLGEADDRRAGASPRPRGRRAARRAPRRPARHCRPPCARAAARGCNPGRRWRSRAAAARSRCPSKRASP